MSSILTTVLAASALVTFQDPESPPPRGGWTTDWDAAKAQAQKEEKDLLIDFTGSDWCVWCQRLKEEVFDLDAFRTAAPKDFVLVELDFPQDRSAQSDELQARNEQLRSEFGVDSFPTILLADEQGRPYATTGYQDGGVESYLEHLGELRKTRDERDAFAQRAATADGLDKARLLADAIGVVPAELHRHYLPWMDEIIALDADGAAGLKPAFEQKKREIAAAAMVAEVQKAVNEAAEREDWAGAAKVIDDFLTAQAEVADDNVKHELLFYRAMIASQSGDHALAIQKLEEAKRLVPDHEMNPRIDQVIEQLKKMGGGD